MGDWCSEDVTDTTTLKNRVWKKRLKITLTRGKIVVVTFAREKITFLLEWGEISLDKGLLVKENRKIT